MNKTLIEWCRNPDNITQGFTLNPVVGCNGIGCAVKEKCWARKQAKRQKHRCDKCYSFTPHTHFERLKEAFSRGKPSGIFLCDMGDLFDKAVTDAEIKYVLEVVKTCTQHRFYILTKQAQRLPDFKYPPNVWLGVTVNLLKDLWRIEKLGETNAEVAFASFEPLYEPMRIGVRRIQNLDWIIIGGQTRPSKIPDSEWVIDIMWEAEEFGVPVFIKNNLKWPQQIQAFPKVEQAV